MNNNVSLPNAPNRVDRSFTLSSLFVLTTLFAIILAMVSPLPRHLGAYGVTESEIVVTVLVGIGSVALIGLIVGLFHRQRLRGSLQGIALGTILGAIMVPSMLIPPSELVFLMLTCLSGCCLILGIATAMRLHARAGEQQEAEDPIVVAEVVELQRHPLDPD